MPIGSQAISPNFWTIFEPLFLLSWSFGDLSPETKLYFDSVSIHYCTFQSGIWFVPLLWLKVSDPWRDFVLNFAARTVWDEAPIVNGRISHSALTLWQGATPFINGMNLKRFAQPNSKQNPAKVTCCRNFFINMAGIRPGGRGS